MYLFPGPRPKKKGLSSNGFTKIVTVRLRSIVPKRLTAHCLLCFFKVTRPATTSKGESIRPEITRRTRCNPKFCWFHFFLGKMDISI
jgi:hypothetical protein